MAIPYRLAKATTNSQTDAVAATQHAYLWTAGDVTVLKRADVQWPRYFSIFFGLPNFLTLLRGLSLALSIFPFYARLVVSEPTTNRK